VKLDLAIVDPGMVVIPDDACAELRGTAGRARIPVTASFDGVPYRGSVVSMGGAMVLGITNAIQAEMHKSVGDTVSVVIEADTAERTVEVPDDLATALDAAGVRDAFDRQSYTNRKEQTRSVAEAKKPETRARRIERAVAALLT
jgi:hypothetical protein